MSHGGEGGGLLHSTKLSECEPVRPLQETSCNYEIVGGIACVDFRNSLC
jgi:hypothetical protein